MSYVLVIAAIGAGLGVYLAWLASRLRRLHARVNAAADALSLRLIRRAAVAWELAQTLSELRGGTGAALKQAAMVALDAPSAEREATQSDLTRAIQEAIRRCELPAPRLGEVFAPVLAENRRVEMARSLQMGPKVTLGWFGEFHPSVSGKLDAVGPLAGFEIVLDAIAPPKAKATRTKSPLALSGLQPVRRDFAFVVPREVEAARIVKAAAGADRKLIAGVEVFDLFEGESIGAGNKSVAIEVTLQPTDRTMTDTEIEAVAAKIVADVTKATGASLRK